jgi:UDP:flavonoid glycosyltransferase YjiC (YdhE family)
LISSDIPVEPHPLKVLICPLDWGIGHATRMVPVIRKFKDSGCEVLIAGSGRSLEYLKIEFPKTEFIDFEGKTIRYASEKWLIIKLILELPSFLFHIIREHYRLKKLVRNKNIGLVVSDNRYGCWHAEIPSVFITHQLSVQLPGYLRIAGDFVRKVNYWFIHRYTHCWIPDFEPRMGLAGNLSHPVKMPRNATYIGILSRFSSMITPQHDAIPPSIDVLVLLSGPEPQRSGFEQIIIRQLKQLPLLSVLVRGTPGEGPETETRGNLHIFSHLWGEQLLQLMIRANIVVCRSGYSTIMDLVTVGKKAILVPTPGQTEQEYLAKYLLKKKIYFSMEQDKFDIIYARELSVNFPGMVIRSDETDLEGQVKAIIKHSCARQRRPST